MSKKKTRAPRRAGNPVARAVRTRALRPRRVRPKKGRGSYTRKGRGAKLPDPHFLLYYNYQRLLGRCVFEKNSLLEMWALLRRHFPQIHSALIGKRRLNTQLRIINFILKFLEHFKNLLI